MGSNPTAVTSHLRAEAKGTRNAEPLRPSSRPNGHRVACDSFWNEKRTRLTCQTQMEFLAEARVPYLAPMASARARRLKLRAQAALSEDVARNKYDSMSVASRGRFNDTVAEQVSRAPVV